MYFKTEEGFGLKVSLEPAFLKINADWNGRRRTILIREV